MFATHLKCKSWDFSRYRYNVIFPSLWCRRWLSRCSVVPWIVVGLAYVGLILCADIKKGVVTRLHGDVCLAPELMCRLPRLAARLSPPSPPDLRYLLGTGQRPFPPRVLTHPPPSPAVRSGPSLPPGRQGRSCQGGLLLQNSDRPAAAFLPVVFPAGRLPAAGCRLARNTPAVNTTDSDSQSTSSASGWTSRYRLACPNFPSGFHILLSPNLQGLCVTSSDRSHRLQYKPFISLSAETATSLLGSLIAILCGWVGTGLISSRLPWPSQPQLTPISAVTLLASRPFVKWQISFWSCRVIILTPGFVVPTRPEEKRR